MTHDVVKKPAVTPGSQMAFRKETNEDDALLFSFPRFARRRANARDGAISGVAAALLLPGVAGCGNGEGRHAAVYPVAGQVLREGQPLDGATVTFYFQGKHDAKFAPLARGPMPRAGFVWPRMTLPTSAGRRLHRLRGPHPYGEKGGRPGAGAERSAPHVCQPENIRLAGASQEKGPTPLPPFSLGLAKP